MRRRDRERDSAEHGRSSRLHLHPRARSRTRYQKSDEPSKRLFKSRHVSPIRARIEARIDEGHDRRSRVRRSGSKCRTPPSLVLNEEREVEPPPLTHSDDVSGRFAPHGRPTPSSIRAPSHPSMSMAFGASMSAYDGRPIPSLVKGAPPLTPIPTASPPLSPPEPESMGTFLRFLLNCCRGDRTSEEYYEIHWQGHQPLASPTWEIDPVESFGAQSGAGSVCDGSVAGSDLRMMRRRRKRGVVSPRSNLAQERDPSLAIRADDKFPGDVTDPHLVARKKWEPDCERAAPDLPGTSPKPKGMINWGSISGCAPGLA